MSGWLYLIRNKDLHKIGITKNFVNRMRQLKPDAIVAKLYTRDYVKLERELHNRYRNFRLPQTEYFRLEDHHLKEIKQRISNLGFPLNKILGIFIRSLLFIVLIFFLILVFISLYVNDKNIILSNSLLLMERLSLGLSLFSIFFRSGKYISFLTEIKYRISRLIIFILFALFFRIAYIFL